MSYRCVTTLKEIRDYLSGAAIVAFDFETAPTDHYRDNDRAALDAHKADIVGVSFSVKEGSAIYVPLHHRQGENAENAEKILCSLQDILWMNHSVTKVAHNLAFEAMFLYAQGIVLQAPVYDTIAASQLTLKNNSKFRGLSDSGLKKLVPQFFGEDMTTFTEVTDGAYFDELSPQEEATIHYACADSDYTLRLYHLFNGWFGRYMPKHRVVVEEVESPTAVFCGIMKYNGLPMDKPSMLVKQQEAEKKLCEIKSEIAFMIGDVDIGANASTAAFKQYLFKDLALPVLKTTARFQEAADDQTMILLTEWCRENRPELVPLFELVQEYRKWGKIKSTYIDGYLKHLNDVTGRIHPDLMPLGTETGRFAARNPNLQNMPRKDNDPIGIRRFIKASDGKIIMSLDFSQIELRVGAFYCRDRRMLETYRGGGDIHAQTTAVIYHIPFDVAVDKNAPHYKERRTIAKNCNFGVFFGLFAKGLQRTLKFKAGLDTPLEECDSIIHNLKAGYPMLEKWQKDVVVQAKSRRYTQTWIGRRRYLPNIESKDWGKRSFAERCSMNTPIQGTAADILKLAIGHIVRELPDKLWLKPMLQIHDELVFELPAERLPEAVAFVKRCMETQPFPKFDLPIVAEASAGSNFGAMEELEV